MTSLLSILRVKGVLFLGRGITKALWSHTRGGIYLLGIMKLGSNHYFSSLCGWPTFPIEAAAWHQVSRICPWGFSRSKNINNCSSFACFRYAKFKYGKIINVPETSVRLVTSLGYTGKLLGNHLVLKTLLINAEYDGTLSSKYVFPKQGRQNVNILK